MALSAITRVWGGLPVAGNQKPPADFRDKCCTQHLNRKAAGGFWIKRNQAPETVLLVEGAIDALSAWILVDRTQIDIVISTAGATGRMPEWVGGLSSGPSSADMTPTRSATRPPKCSKRKTQPFGACGRTATATSRTGMKSCNARETIPNPTRSRTRDGSTEPSSQISAKREESSRTEQNNSGNPRQFKPKNNSGTEVKLTSTEYELLRLLSVNAGRVVHHVTILRQVWSERDGTNANLVRIFVRTLRRKLGDNAETPNWIFNQRGVGYRMPRPGPGEH